MGERLRAAVITTRDRVDAYTACVEAIAPQVDLILTVHHAPPSEQTGTDQEVFFGHPWLFPDDVPHDLVSVAKYREERPNISKMWNIGLRAVHIMAWERGLRYNVAVLNDDAVVPTGWFETITAAMCAPGWEYAAGSMSPGVGGTVSYGDPAPTNLHHRMTGYAFILNGDALVKADEEMRWWGSDCAIDFAARERGGTVVIPDTGVQHPPNGSPLAPYQAEWWAEDQIKFREKWGCDYA